MTIKISFFATLKEKAGQAAYELEPLGPISVLELKNKLCQAFPGINVVKDQILVAVNQEFSFDDEIIPEQAEVAIFPPVSGGSTGSTICRIVTTELDLNSLVDEITSPGTGAACIFTGIVRGHTEKGNFHETSSLEYEAYLPMAEAKLKQVAEEIRTRWPSIDGISIVQRIGLMEPRTPTVVVACSAAHRNTGVFDAAHYGIDRLKEIVPIWKKEIGPQGETWVEGSYIPGKGD
ncbi:MAG: molybdenum cofactor biosynthesis protein MoaE [Anaerolineaceae bacterium]